MRYIKALLLSLFACAIAHAQKPTTESVEKLLDVMQVKDMIGPIEKQMHTMVGRMTSDPRISGNMTDAQKDQLAKATDKEFAAIEQALTWDSLKDLYISTYQDSFTQPEVDAMIAFYQTPAGASIVKKYPQAMQTSMMKMQAKLVPAMQKMMADLQQSAQEIKTAGDASGASAPAAPVGQAPAAPAKPAGN